MRGQEALFGAVASQTTAHRVIKSIDEGLLEGIRAARAKARRRAWDGTTMHVICKKLVALKEDR